MSENHELRLKIDAAAAKSGASEFQAAINAVKKAVQDLERDSTGAFTKLTKNLTNVNALGKVKLPGVDGRTLSDLDAFSKLQAAAAKAVTATTKVVQTQINTLKNFGSAYTSARKDVDALNNSLTKVNTSLARQVQLSAQARNAVRSPTSTKADTARSPGTATSAEALNLIIRLYNEVGIAGMRAGVNAATGSNAASAAAREQAKAAADAARAVSLQERLQLASAAAMRTATLEAARLTERLQRIGDTSGVLALNNALTNLRATATGDVSSFGALRAAVSEFSNATTNAKVALVASDGAQRQAAQGARELAAQNRAAASTAQSIEREMRSIAGASNATAQALAKVTGNMRGLENAFSSTFQVGSMFRNLLGSITLGTFTKSVFEAGNSLDQFRVTMEVAAGSATAAAGEMQFIDDMTRKLGTNLASARDSYSKFAISSSLAGVASADTQKIFESVSMALSVLGKGTEDQNLSFLALEQMMSKGTISSEELRRQLGERLPGAVNLMAKALGVTTEELQKMLKAGSISSADALPKFAAQLQKEFGPGLQNAIKRAGFSLGTMQGELQRLMETVAQSGFMQTLSVQFQALTTAMQSDVAREAAVSLGEGFATMAELGGEAMLYLIQNADRVGVVIKGIFAGIIVRQVAAAGQALVTSSQQMLAWMASWGTSAATMTRAEAASLAHTQAVSMNTRALLVNGEASAVATLGVKEYAAAQRAGALSMGMVGTSATAAGGAIGGSVRALGFLSRGLAVLGPMAAIAVTAISVIPALMGDIASSAEVSQQRLDAALKRAGVSLDTFRGDAAKSTSLINLQQNLSDLTTFREALKEFRSDYANTNLYDYGAGTLTKENSLNALRTAASGQSVKNYNGYSSADQFAGLGVSADAFDKMSQSGKLATADILGMVDAASKGQASFIDLYSAITKTMTVHPDTSGVMEPLRSWITNMATAEAATLELKNRLINLYGTPDQKFLKTFVDAATVVATTGEGMQDLNDKIAEAQKTSPQLVATLQQIKADAAKGLSVGITGAEFTKQQMPLYFTGSAAEKVIQSQERLKQANDAYAASFGKIDAAYESTMDAFSKEDLSKTGMNNWDMADQFVLQLAKMKTARDAFVDQPIDPVAIGKQFSAETYSGASPQMVSNMRSYTTEVIKQYNALKPTEQTYLNLRTIMSGVEQSYNRAGVSLGGYVNGLAEQARQGRVAGISSMDMVASIEMIIDANHLQGTALADSLRKLEAASIAHDGYGRAATNAASAVETATNATLNIASGANAGIAAINGLITALQNLFSLGGGIASSGAAIVANIQTQIDIAKARGAERAYLQTMATGEGAKFQTESEAAIAEADARAATATTAAERIAATASATIGRISLWGVRTAIKTKTTELFTAQEAAKNENNGGSSGAGGAPKLIDAKKVYKDITERTQALERDNLALSAQINSTYQSEEAAKLYGEAMVAGGGAVDQMTLAQLQQIDAAALLNDQLTRLARDPVKEFLATVPIWEEASRTIQGSIVNNLSDTLAEFFKTGKLDLASFASSVAGTMADVLAKQTTGWALGKLGIKGSLGKTGDAAEMASGGQQAGGMIHNAMVSAGQIVSNMFHGSLNTGARTAGTAIQSSVVSGGQQAAVASRMAGQSNAMQLGTTTTVTGSQHAAQVGQAIVTGANYQAGAIAGASGGGGGGFLGTLISFAAGMFSEGGYSDAPAVSNTLLSPAAFRNAPHYKEGTANTSGGGIPAVLHPNEAVIPLSRGRKIPVEMTGKPSESQNVTSMTMGDIHVSIQTDHVGDATQAAAAADQIAQLVALRVQEEMATQMRYGGIMNPRGR